MSLYEDFRSQVLLFYGHCLHDEMETQKQKIKFKAWPNKNSRCLHSFSLLLKHDRLFCYFPTVRHNTGIHESERGPESEAKVKLITLFISFLTAKILHNFFNFSLLAHGKRWKVNRQKNLSHIYLLLFYSLPSWSLLLLHWLEGFWGISNC